MLVQKTFYNIMQEALLHTDMLMRSTLKIAKFEEFCGVLREQGCSFTESLSVDEIGVGYYIKPDNPGDYLAIVESLAGMNALRTPGPVYDYVNIEPEVPMFWLHAAPADVCTADLEGRN
jgi:hypothetical protein